MSLTATYQTALRRIGVLVVMSAGATLAGLGAVGNAAADTFDPAAPFTPDQPRYSLQMPWDARFPTGPDRGDTVTLNPQPLPPGPDLGDSVTLNPQSLPPGPDRGDSVSLNPQPLPPGPDRSVRVGLNPQPLPPGPDLRLPFLRLLPRF